MSGNWSGQAPACQVRSCPALNLSSNLNIQGNVLSTQYNTVVVFECDTGHTLNGSASTRCLADKTWSNSLPSCDVVTCPSISQPLHGLAEFSSLDYSNTVNYSCDSGYQHYLNTSKSVCQADGEWSIRNFTCCGKSLWLADGLLDIHVCVLEFRLL